MHHCNKVGIDTQITCNYLALIRIALIGLFLNLPNTMQAQSTAKIVEKEKATNIIGFDFGVKTASIRTGGYDPGLPQRSNMAILQNAFQYGMARKKHEWVFVMKFGIGTSTRRRGGINMNFSEWGPAIGYARIIQVRPSNYLVPSVRLGFVSRSLSLYLDSTAQMRTRFSNFSSLHLHIEPGIYLSMPHSKNRKRPVRTSLYFGYSHDFSSRNFSVGERRPRKVFASTAASGFFITWNMQVLIP